MTRRRFVPDRPSHAPGGRRSHGRADPRPANAGPLDDARARRIRASSTCSCRCSSRPPGYSVKTISVGTGPGARPRRARRGRRYARARARPWKKYVEGGQDAEPAARHVQRLRRHRPRRRSGASQGLEGGRGAPAHRGGLGALRVARRQSGTHLLEQALWKQAGLEPRGTWYIESGQGMGQTLLIANERKAYALTDRGTYLAFQKRVELLILVEKDRPLLNIYSVMEVNPANGPRVNAAAGKAFADFRCCRPPCRRSSRPSGSTSTGSRCSCRSPASGRRRSADSGRAAPGAPAPR